ncbi:putative channel protein [Gordonia hirsuta DSM 44140 = NBRC 16056]|uniref:Putative channel protein n=1 Tax=Gordonia hirsuta DSM 44140 = NBRC 16056 TaxID=1121927 RepID=L7L5J6_9ACTN|nr:copper transporter [Gordonia hirsuta]GAC56001.1 putative channel protein [Gordonia hirsuta DSM 44140 = NBRC 16056]
MISLRQHAISLIAVFLALALGLFLGAGFIGDGLNRLTGADRDRLGTVTDERDALARQVNTDSGFIEGVTGRLVSGRLDRTSVLVVTAPTAAESDVEAVKGLLNDAGADFSGQLDLTTALVRDENSTKLASIVAQSVPDGQQLRADFTDSGSRLGDLLGATLLVRENAGPVAAAQRDTVLQTLRAGGFLNYADGAIKPADLVVVMTGGAMPSDAGAQGQLIGRLAAAMAQRGRGGVLAGREGSAEGGAPIAVVRADPALGRSLSTVDDVGEQAGRLTVVLAAAAEKDGRSGAYGSGPGASSITVP